ncbi:hypothetical protein ACSBOB_20220 [Mesorhizobium sp. ASY16-5R]|uniref:hypothetical protein n=1 Tax=Mesorhizobium sp. ASY16-5R TaxID=3445772 RepID=UPI003FA06181
MPWVKQVAVILAELLKALAPYFPSLAAFLGGVSWQQTRQSARELESVERAMRAASRVELLPDADVVPELKERRLYRVSDK